MSDGQRLIVRVSLRQSRPPQSCQDVCPLLVRRCRKFSAVHAALGFHDRALGPHPGEIHHLILIGLALSSIRIVLEVRNGGIQAKP